MYSSRLQSISILFSKTDYKHSRKCLCTYFGNKLYVFFQAIDYMYSSRKQTIYFLFRSTLDNEAICILFSSRLCPLFQETNYMLPRYQIIRTFFGNKLHVFFSVTDYMHSSMKQTMCILHSDKLDICRLVSTRLSALFQETYYMYSSHNARTLLNELYLFFLAIDYKLSRKKTICATNCIYSSQ